MAPTVVLVEIRDCRQDPMDVKYELITTSLDADRLSWEIGTAFQGFYLEPSGVAVSVYEVEARGDASSLNRILGGIPGVSVLPKIIVTLRSWDKIRPLDIVTLRSWDEVRLLDDSRRWK